MGEMPEHRAVIGRIAGEDDACAIGIGVDGEGLAQQAPRHGELVIGAVPAIDMNGADLGRGPMAREDGEDPVDGFGRQGGHILAEVDGEIGLAIGLVRGHRRPRHLRQHLGPDNLQPGAIGGAGGGVDGIDPGHATLVVEMAEIEGAVLADHPVDGPLAGDEIAPTRRPARDGDDDEPRRPQALHGVIARRRQPAVIGQRVVDICKHRAHAGPLGLREFRQGPEMPPLAHAAAAREVSRPDSAARSRKV